jgi:hypothetical protein
MFLFVVDALCCYAECCLDVVMCAGWGCGRFACNSEHFDVRHASRTLQNY